VAGIHQVLRFLRLLLFKFSLRRNYAMRDSFGEIGTGGDERNRDSGSLILRSGDVRCCIPVAGIHQVLRFLRLLLFKFSLRRNYAMRDSVGEIGTGGNEGNRDLVSLIL
jgi:hypothetical protein